MVDPPSAPAGPRRALEGRKVLFLLGSLDLGGAERQALLLARHLVEAEGARAVVWGFGPPGRVSDLCAERGIPWRSLTLRWTAGRAARLASLAGLAARLRAERPEVILPYTTIPAVACGVAAPWSGARFWIWNQRDEGLGHPAGTLERAAARRTPLFAANSAGAARFLTETLGVDRARVRIVPNGVEIPSPSGGRDAWRARLGAGPSDFVASMIANLHDNKDHATLLKAWRLAVDRAPLRDGRPLLALAGRPGGREDRLRALALELALGDSVRFLGSVEDVAGLLGASDLAVLSSRSEGCPNGVLEPMAAGLPVAGTDVPGIRGALGPEGSRLLAPPGDAPSLADRIVEAASDPALRADLGAAGRRRIETAFSPRRMCSAMTDLLAGGPAAA